MRANADVVVVAFRDSVAAVAPRPGRQRGRLQRPAHLGQHRRCRRRLRRHPRCRRKAGDREQASGRRGVHRAEGAPRRPGLSARVDVDTRFITRRRALKTAVMVLGVSCVVAAIVALAVLDRYSGHRLRGAWRRRLRANARHVAGRRRGGRARWCYGISSARSPPTTATTWSSRGCRADAGYFANYYRYFGATEAPFDWYQGVLGQLASVSTAGVWMRLPATLAGIGCWLILSPLRAADGSGARWPPTGWRSGPRARCSWPRGCRSTTACDPSRSSRSARC